jgi:hypothetical protein
VDARGGKAGGVSAATERPATAFEAALADYNGFPLGAELGIDALYRMVRSLHEELTQERAIVRSQGEVIGELRQRIWDAECHVATHGSDISALRYQATQGATQTVKTEPSVRVRINHGRTAKDGWRVTETTVEFAGPGLPEVAAVRDALRFAYEEGYEEAAVRNDNERDEVAS